MCLSSNSWLFRDQRHVECEILPRGLFAVNRVRKFSRATSPSALRDRRFCAPCGFGIPLTVNDLLEENYARKLA